MEAVPRAATAAAGPGRAPLWHSERKRRAGPAGERGPAAWGARSRGAGPSLPPSPPGPKRPGPALRRAASPPGTAGPQRSHPSQAEPPPGRAAGPGPGPGAERGVARAAAEPHRYLATAEGSRSALAARNLALVPLLPQRAPGRCRRPTAQAPARPAPAPPHAIGRPRAPRTIESQRRGRRSPFARAPSPGPGAESYAGGQSQRPPGVTNRPGIQLRRFPSPGDT